MPLKTLVKVGNISNLSDARYCSGMGVDMLGFRVIASQANNIPHKVFQEIRGWISGPKIVAELYGIQGQDLTAIISNYVPDYFEMSYAEFKENSKLLTLPSIIYLTREELTKADLDSESENIAYLVVDEDDIGLLAEYTLPYPVLVRISTHKALEEKLETNAVSGIALNGSPELRPGFKDYNELADILEALEEP
jgi:phosphoribosylanthranilate isomerase